jgi:hypothetical protein
MLHTVEARISEEHFRDFIGRVRRWMDSQNTHPTTFRYWLYEPETLVRVNFESKEQATAFAEAFGGIVISL